MKDSEVKAVRAFLLDNTDDLSKYFDGLAYIRYLYSYEKLYERARRDILTWTNAREYFLFNDRRELFWESHRSFSHFILLSHAVVEYLSTRILLEHFDPKQDREEMLSVFEGIGQFNRQDMMHELGIISGNLNNEMNKVRGVRNDFAHEVSPHFELGYDEHPLLILNNVRNVTRELSHILYGEKYGQIIELFNKLYSDTFPDDYSATSTAELIEIYQFETEDGGGLYDQELARELYQRNVDPEAAPSFEEFVSIDYLDDVGTGWADSHEMGVAQLRAAPYVPDSVYIEEVVTIEAHIEFLNDSLFHKLPGELPSEFEWYCYLMIDNRVVAIEPTDSDGCPKTRTDKTGIRIPISFDYTFREDGEHEITIGLQILNDSFRFHFVLFQTETKAYGPFTS
jgi:hypothetical protein